ncbi:contractile injection system tape measure protein [Aquimarina sp. RZ0]|uniref:contractile injection system tape measure protein n=1 Tax=Aquimarina sp. RZ0 TaxID=2607730 RepID=UPI0011F27117|nr:contractile injection system tape measure protein [Aquimarina sp. RZ0]KAA1247758.1 hypothetical protein F0000_02820 [Aquimarina sp. RZ0]
MKNEQTHIIKSQRYEVVLEQSSEAYSYQSKISYLQTYQIQSLLQKIMDKYSSEEFLDQFEEIVLDLGTVSPSNFEKEIFYRVEEALTTFLENNSFDNGTLKTGKRVQIYNKKIDQFAFFLKNGYVNWQVVTTERPEQLFLELIANNKEALIKLVKEQGQKEVIRTRMIAQLKDSFLEQIVEGVAGNEGIYINQYRQDIIRKQKSEKLIETATADFRKATWEIVLTYIFVEANGYYNRKSFLKLLIYKIAQKYRLTYKSLLRTIILGIKDRHDKGRKVLDFEKLLITLQEEAEKEGKTRNDYQKKGLKKEEQDFIKTLQYFMNYGSLPVGIDISSFQEFYKKVVSYIDNHPRIFTDFIDGWIQQSSKIDRLIKQFPDAILYKILSRSKNTIILKLTAFMSLVHKIAEQRLIEANSLKKIQGMILLKTYKKILHASGSEWREFLFQIILHITIDTELLEVLKKTESLLPSQENEIEMLYSELIINRIEVTGIEEVQVSEKVLSQVGVSERLYHVYNQRERSSVEEFKVFLEKEIHIEKTIKIVYTLLELCAKSKTYTTTEISEWVVKRVEELKTQGKYANHTSVIREILKLLRQLGIPETIVMGVEGALTILQKRKNKQLPAIKSSDEISRNIPDTIYKILIEQIYDQFYKQTEQNLHERITTLFLEFSNTYKVSVTYLKEGLKKQIANRKDVQLIKRIIEDISSESTITVQQKVINIQYKLDVIQYFSDTATLPWWAKDTQRSVVQEYLAEVITEFPERFLHWYRMAKNQYLLIGIMKEHTYDTFLGQINSSVSRQVFQIKEYIEQLLTKKIKQIRQVTQDHIHHIRHMIVSYAFKNGSIHTLDFTRYLINAIARVFTIEEDSINILLNEQIKDNKTTEFCDEVFSWLDSQVKRIASQDEVIEVKKLIEEQKDWESVIRFTPRKEVLFILKTIQKTKPAGLLFNLKRMAFRKQLISTLSHKEQLVLVQLFMDIPNQSKFTDMMTVFEKLRRHITGSQYQKIWAYFIETVLLTIAIDKPADWSVKRWCMLLTQSVWMLKDAIDPETILLTIAAETAGAIQNVLLQTREGIVQKKEEVFLIEEEVVFQETPEEIIGDAIYIKNAGMVILGPYIPMLFDRLKFTENGKFKNEDCIQKGIHILQYAVTGRAYEEEQQLALNKIICGIDIHTPVQKYVDIAPEEKELVKGLLQAIITNWSILKNTSIEGLRESFLRRDARIVIEEDSYILTVEQKSFDMLLDQIPWSIAKLKLSWMQKLLEVLWRQ